MSGLTSKHQEANRLRTAADSKRSDADRLRQNELARYQAAGDENGVKNVQQDIDKLIAEAERLESTALYAENDARRLGNEIDTHTSAMNKLLADQAAYQDQVRIAQGHIDSIQHEISSLQAKIDSIS